MYFLCDIVLLAYLNMEPLYVIQGVEPNRIRNINRCYFLNLPKTESLQIKFSNPKPEPELYFKRFQFDALILTYFM